MSEAVALDALDVRILQPVGGMIASRRSGWLPLRSTTGYGLVGLVAFGAGFGLSSSFVRRQCSAWRQPGRGDRWAVL